MNTQPKDYYVTSLYGTKFHYAMPAYLLFVCIFNGIRIFIDLNIIYLILMTIISIPMIIISVKSKIKQHKLEILNDELLIGIQTIERESLYKIVIYKPTTIYFHIKKTSTSKGFKIEGIQIKKEDAASVFSQLSLWSKHEDIKLEMNY